MTKHLLYLLFVSSFLSSQASEWTLDSNIKETKIKDNKKVRLIWPGKKILLRCKDSAGKTIADVEWSCTKSPQNTKIKGNVASLWRPTHKKSSLKVPGVYVFQAKVGDKTQSLKFHIQDILGFTVDGSEVKKKRKFIGLNSDKSVRVQLEKALKDLPLPSSFPEWKVNGSKVSSQNNRPFSQEIFMKAYAKKETKIEVSLKEAKRKFSLKLIPVGLRIKGKSDSKGAKFTLDLIGPSKELSLKKGASFSWTGPITGKKGAPTTNRVGYYLFNKKSSRGAENITNRIFFEGYGAKGYTGNVLVNEHNKIPITATVSFPSEDLQITGELKAILIEYSTIYY